MNVNALGAKNIKTQENGDPVAGVIDATGITSVIYDGTSFIVLGNNESTPITARGDIIRGNSSGIQERLAVGAANTFLQSDGTDAAWTAIDGANSAWNLIATVTASMSTTVDFLSGITSAHDVYMITISGLDPESDSNLLVRLSDDGSTFEADATDYQYVATGIAEQGASADVAVQAIGDDGGNTFIQLNAVTLGLTEAGEGVSGIIYMYHPASTALHTRLTWTIGGANASLQEITSSGSGRIASTAANNGIRFLMSTGEITSGEFALYGLRNS